MKAMKMMFAGIAVLALAAIATTSFATDNGTATAKIVTAIAIEQATPLNFGSIIYGTAGSVAISHENVRTPDTVSVLVASAHSAAVFHVTGAPLATYTLTLPEDAITVINDAVTSGTKTMSVDDWTCNVAETAGAGVLDGIGAQTVNVGATLAVGANQCLGTYNGTFDVAVAYN